MVSVETSHRGVSPATVSVMEVVAGDLPAKKNYTLSRGRLCSPMGMKKWPLNTKTVASVDLVSDRFLNSVGTSRTLFGVGETLADLTTMGLSGVGKGQQTTLFKIDFTDGTTITCHGTAHKKVLRFASK